MNYFYNLYHAFWTSHEDGFHEPGLNAPAATNDKLEEDCSTFAETIEELWDVFNTNAGPDWAGNQITESLTKLNETLDQMFGWTAPENVKRHLAKYPDAARQLQDILLLVAMCDPGEGYVQLKLCERFNALFGVPLSFVLSKTSILRPQVGVIFHVPSLQKFCKTATMYVRTIEQLDQNWKKQIYFVQFLNYLANNREMYLWKFSNLHKAVMDKLTEFENAVGGVSLPWHKHNLQNNTRHEKFI
jgi:hypothetical protein